MLVELVASAEAKPCKIQSAVHFSRRSEKYQVSQPINLLVS